jgi:hypothetical protein
VYTAYRDRRKATEIIVNEVLWCCGCWKDQGKRMMK